MTLLRRVSYTLGVLTFCLIVWGGHVNSTNSGMAFPDWPTSNTSAMVSYTPSEWWMQGARFWEHGHRLFATLVGAVTTLLVVVAYRNTPRSARPNRTLIALLGAILAFVVTAVFGFHAIPGRMLEVFMALLTASLLYFLFKAAKANSESRILWLSMAAFVAVCLQGAFGGITVRNNLPWWTSTIHGMLAEVFLMIVLGIAFLAWKSQALGFKLQALSFKPNASSLKPKAFSLKPVVIATFILTFIQFFLGAVTRHTHAWGVSVQWPQWGSDGFFPSSEMLQHPQVLVHFLHRTLAYVVAIMVVGQWFALRTSKLALVSLLLVFAQIGLGVAILLTFRNEIVTTMHVMTGAALLAVNTLLLYSTSHARAVVGEQSEHSAFPIGVQR